MIKFFRIPQIFYYQVSIFIKLFITSPEQVQCFVSPGTSTEVRSFVLPCSTSLPTWSDNPTHNGFTGSLCNFQNSVLCGSQTVQYILSFVEQYSCYLLHQVTEHYHPHSHQGQKVEWRMTVYEPSQYSHSKSLVPDHQYDYQHLQVCTVWQVSIIVHP